MKIKEIGRLAIRHEGKYWNAYWAMPHTMDGAILLGSIAMAGIRHNPARKEAFMQMMKEFAAEILEDKTGVPAEAWDTREAPEHEKAGHA